MRVRRRRHDARVRLVSRLFTPEVGAAAFRLRVLADAFADAGRAVEVLTTRPPAEVPPGADGALTVRRWPVLRDAGGNVRGYVQYLSFDVPLFVRMLLSSRSDVTIVEPPPTTGLVSRVALAVHRRPYVWYAGDVWSDGVASMGAPRAVVAGMRAAESWVARGALRVLCISDEVAERIAGLGVSRDRLIVVGNGVDTEVFTPKGPTPEAPAEFVYTGTMSEWQGAEVFVEALAKVRVQVPGARLVLLGQGSAVTDIMALADRIAPGAVESRGVVPPATCAAWIRGARAALVSIKPGLGYDFAKPTKIYAATACGTPVVYAGAGAGQQLVEQARLGWAPGYDVDAVAVAMLAALRQPSPERDELSLRCITWTRGNASLRAQGRVAAAGVIAALGS
ncbi:MAG: glycosyltransferase family 4 protein [Intrasporangium sp.]|uniref:glycosyltransferase family 4 protein n=1 Tax=Intrasporangium sp. TaxID=1925024 RepID=UPI0026494361|nr:glycosyltransferase family 4 protein [Intrasporangium sp.]MDN5794459.1 glycosyltransferase family 4 protein [Intrasporangium sp.]